MFDVLSIVLDLALFIVCVGWVGRRPTTAKTTAMIALVAAVNVARDSAVAASQGLNIYELYRSSFDGFAESYASVFSAEQISSMQPYWDTIAGCWLGIYVVQAAWLVFIGLGLVWIVRKVLRRTSAWAPFSSIDLPIGMVSGLIVGILLLAVSNIGAVPFGSTLRLVGLNILVIGLLPIGVQGCAAYKGVMNRVNIPAVAQVVITVVLLFFGLALPVVLVFGIVDFWANIRRLPREADEDEARTYM